MEIYTILLIEKIEENAAKRPRVDMGATRLVGYYRDYESAKNAANSNACDLHEYLYDYLCIEKVEEGVFRPCEEPKFFKYNKEKDGFFEVEMPKALRSVVGFTIG